MMFVRSVCVSACVFKKMFDQCFFHREASLQKLQFSFSFEFHHRQRCSLLNCTVHLMHFANVNVAFQTI